MFKVKLFNNPSVDLICEDSVQSIIMYSERQRIIQVMANLIHNAIKFTKSGEIRFSCRMEGTDEVYFYVSDTGIGIPKEEQQEIFSSFKKLDLEVPGTGHKLLSKIWEVGLVWNLRSIKVLHFGL